MSNKELVIYDNELVHCYIALRRKSKGNAELSSNCIRQIIRNPELDLDILKVKLKHQKGLWRIHRTVNRRSVSNAWKVLQHRIIDDNEIPFKLESAWKTALLQKEGKGERKFQLDVDTKNPDELKELFSLLREHSLEILEEAETPNGFHYITNPFDFNKILGHLEFVDVLRDGYIFIEEYKAN